MLYVHKRLLAPGSTAPSAARLTSSPLISHVEPARAFQCCRVKAAQAEALNNHARTIRAQNPSNPGKHTFPSRHRHKPGSLEALHGESAVSAPVTKSHPQPGVRNLVMGAHSQTDNPLSVAFCLFLPLFCNHVRKSVWCQTPCWMRTTASSCGSAATLEVTRSGPSNLARLRGGKEALDVLMFCVGLPVSTSRACKVF